MLVFSQYSGWCATEMHANIFVRFIYFFFRGEGGGAVFLLIILIGNRMPEMASL